MSVLHSDLINELSKFREKMKENYRIVKQLIYLYIEIWEYYINLNSILAKYPQLYDGDECIYSTDGDKIVKDRLKEDEDYPVELIFDLCKIMRKDLETPVEVFNDIFIENDSNIRVLKISETYLYEL